MDTSTVQYEGDSPSKENKNTSKQIPDLIRLGRHERILKEIFVELQPSVLDDDFSEGFSATDDIVDAMWVVQLTGYDDPNVSTFAYCLSCYKRTKACAKVVVSQERLKLLEVVQKYCVRYAVVVVQEPDLFGAGEIDFPTSPTQTMIQQLGKGFFDGFLTEFLAELGKSDAGELGRLLGPVVVEIVEKVKQGGDDMALAMAALSPLVEFTQHKALRPMIVTLPTFLAPENTIGNDFQVQTLLGSLFSFSLCSRAANVDNGIFKEIVEPNRMMPDTVRQMEVARSEISNYQKMLHTVTLSLLKSANSKGKVLDWLAMAVNLNRNRAQDAFTLGSEGTGVQNVAATLADDGFHLNLDSVIMRLCEKYTDPKVWPPNFEKIDINYLKRTDSRIDSKEDTPLGESKAPSHHLLDSQPSSYGDTRNNVSTSNSASSSDTEPVVVAPANFITESFFLALRSLHIGLLPCIKRYQRQYFNDRASMLRHLVREQRRFKEMRQTMANRGPMFEQRMDAEETKLADKIATESRKMFRLMTHLCDSTYVHEVLNFYTYVCAWLIKIVDPDGKGLPLDENVPDAFSQLPAFIVEDIAEYFGFIATFVPENLDQVDPEKKKTLARFISIFIGDQNYIRNPYVLSTLVRTLANFTPEKLAKSQRRTQFSTFFGVFLTEPLSVKHLYPALFRFFVNMEETDPYERSDRRRQVSVIMKELWKSPPHRAALLATQDDSQFLRFIMLLINDTVDELDEGRKGVDEANKIKAEINDPSFASLTPQQQDDKNKSLAQWKGTAKYHFEFGAEYIDLFTVLTSEIQESFLKAEVVERLGFLLNYNLIDMVKATTDPVKNKDYIEFEVDAPLITLQLVIIYVQVAGLGHVHATDDTKRLKPNEPNESFVNAVARDERSFNPAMFRKASTIINQVTNKHNVPAGVARFGALVDEFEKVALSDADDEAELGEIPDEYVDPIMATLMTDPVLLPTSNQIMDRAVIRAHLLTNPRDPFNRQALKIEDLVPQDDLRNEIEAWVKSKRTKTRTQSQ